MNLQTKIIEAYAGNLESLYARDSNSNIKVWKIGFNNGNLAVYHGKLNGRLVKTILNSEVNTDNPVTSGRILTLIKRRIKDKRKEGYVYISEIPDRNLDNLPKYNTSGLGVSLVMRATKLKLAQVPKLNRYQWLLQPKYNGVRCTAEFAIEDTYSFDMFEAKSEYLLLSREGAEYNAPAIEDDLGMALNYLSHHFGLKDFKLDGELYIHGRTLDYIRTCIPIKKENDKTFSIPSGNINEITYIVYDIMIADMIQKDRHSILKSLNDYLMSEHAVSVIVDAGEIMAIDDALTTAQIFRNVGYEGGIIRRLDSDYKFGTRTSMIRKIKFSNDAEFEIVDIIDDGIINTNGKERVKVKIVLRNDVTNDTFMSVPGNPAQPFTNERKLDLLRNKEKLIGKMATIKFMERSSKKIPVQSNLITIRDYE